MVLNEFSGEEDAQFLIIPSFYMVHNLSMNLSPFLFLCENNSYPVDIWREKSVSTPTPKFNGDFNPFLKNFVILPLLFWNGAAICPYYVTPFGLLGLNGRKKLKKKKCLEEKIVMPLALSPFTQLDPRKETRHNSWCRDVGR